MLTGNHSEKKVAENIMRAGSGSRTIRDVLHGFDDLTDHFSESLEDKNQDMLT